MFDQQIITHNRITYSQEHIEFCLKAKMLEDSGEYEAAAEALGVLWLGIGERPDIEEFPAIERAEILVRVGSLTGWLGSSNQVEGSQEAAKDLIGEGVRIFNEFEIWDKFAESQSDLGVCYWREGAYPEAQNYYQDALDKVSAESYALRGKILLRLINVAISTKDYQNALSLLKEAKPLIETYGDNLLQGKFYFHRALVFRRLFEEENNFNFVEKAAKDYKKASYYYGQANHQRYEAIVENNLGFLFLSVSKCEDAHNHLDNAVNLFGVFKDSGRVASVFDTKARVFLEQNKLIEAELFAKKSVELFSKGDEYSSLSESLTTLGTVLARQKSYTEATEAFENACRKAEYNEDKENAGLAVLAQIEEMQTVLSEEEKIELYERATNFLASTKSLKTSKRLFDAAKICQLEEVKSDWEDFNLIDTVKNYEAKFIKRALFETDGKVTKAAELLGISHQQLSLLLKKRHKELAPVKTPRSRRSDRKKVIY